MALPTLNEYARAAGYDFPVGREWKAPELDNLRAAYRALYGAEPPTSAVTFEQYFQARGYDAPAGRGFYWQEVGNVVGAFMRESGGLLPAAIPAAMPEPEPPKKKKSGGLGGLVGGLVGFAVGGPVGAAIGAGGGSLAETGDLAKSLAAAGLAFGGGQLAGGLGGAGQAAVAGEVAALTGSGVAVGGALGTGATAGVTAAGLQSALQMGQQAVKVASYFNQATGQRIDVAPNAPVPQGFRLIEVRDATVQSVTDTAAQQGAAPAAPQAAVAVAGGMDPRLQLAIAAGLVLLIFFAFRRKG